LFLPLLLCQLNPAQAGFLIVDSSNTSPGQNVGQT